MPTKINDRYVARCAFQRELDRAFPHGAMCAILPVANGQFRAAQWVEGSGRILCSDAKPIAGKGRWHYEVLIDTRTRVDRPRHELRLWVSELTRHPTVSGLWEARIDGDDGARMLRLNAEPPANAMPTPAMRSAVTRLHQEEIFPQGLEP